MATQSGLRRRTTPEALAEVQAHQRAILESAARLLNRRSFDLCHLLHFA